MTFSRQIVSVIAASVLAVHVVVGCCAHHEHVQARVADLLIQSRPAHHDHDGCRHHLADPAAPSDHDKPCDHPCGEGACSFLAASKVILPDLAQPAGIVASDAATLLIQLTPSCIVTDQVVDRATIPPIRSHLAKCVLIV